MKDYLETLGEIWKWQEYDARINFLRCANVIVDAQEGECLQF